MAETLRAQVETNTSLMQRMSAISREFIVREVESDPDGIFVEELYNRVREVVKSQTGEDFPWDYFESDIYWLTRPRD